MPSRRETIKNRKRKTRKLDDTPIEIGIGKRQIPDTKAMVRAYVDQALRQAGATKPEAAEAFLDRELDLDPIDPEPQWTSKYEVQEMEDIPPPRETAPPAERVEEDDEPATIVQTEAARAD